MRKFSDRKMCHFNSKSLPAVTADHGVDQKDATASIVTPGLQAPQSGFLR